MRQIPQAVRNRMLLRSFAIQGSWNYETLIGAGFGYTILPALRFLYGRQGEELDGAVQRHVELFNSHPYVATVAVGAVSTLEANGVDAEVATRFKTALRGSLGSIGDRLIWSTWRPMSLLIAILLLLMGAAWWIAIAVFLIVYNAMHLTVRIVGIQLGSQAGLDVGGRLKELPLQPVIERSSQLAAALIGATVVLAAAPLTGDPFGMATAAVAVLVGALLGFRARGAMVILVAGTAATAIILGLIGYGA